jgi:hypothetical protein
MEFSKAVHTPLRRAIAGLSPHDLSTTLVGCGREPGGAMA